MPSTTAERQRRWPRMDSQAITYLEKRGFTLHRDWTWSAKPGRVLSWLEIDAIVYLIEEWDFGGLR